MDAAIIGGLTGTFMAIMVVWLCSRVCETEAHKPETWHCPVCDEAVDTIRRIPRCDRCGWFRDRELTL